MSRRLLPKAGVALPALSAVLLSAGVLDAAPPPQIRFFDVDSATVSSFVGVYGAGFGAQAGGVSVGSVAATEVPLWSDTLVIFRVPATAVTASSVTIAPKAVADAGTAAPISSASLKLGIHVGKNIYVDAATGLDSAVGDETHPYKTIRKAISVISAAGATVLIHAGEYNEQDPAADGPGFYLPAGLPGGAGKPITVRGFGADLPKLRGTQVHTSANPVAYVGADYARLARIAIDGNDNTSSALSVNGSNVWLVGLDVTGFADRGIVLGEGGENRILGNHIHDGGTKAGVSHGLVLTGEGGAVEHNEIDHIPNGYGVLLEFQTQATTFVDANFIHDVAGGGIGLWRVQGGNRVYNNVVWKAGQSQGCQCAVEVAYGAASGEPATVPDLVYYNSFQGPSLAGVVIADRQGTVVLNGNIGSEFQTAIDVQDDLSRAAVNSSNNLWFFSGGAPLFRWGTGSVDGATGWLDLTAFQTASSQEKNSIVGNPLLVNPSAGDLHLTSGSPAVDKGGGANAPTADFDGVARNDGEPDWGAFELVAGAGGAAGAAGGSAGAGGAAAGAAGAAGTGGTQADAAADAKGGSAGSVVNQDGGAGEADDAGSPAAAGNSEDKGGCGCATPGTMMPNGSWLAMLAMAELLARRRRRSQVLASKTTAGGTD